MQKGKVDFADIEWNSPAPHMRHKVFTDGKRKLRLVEFSRGFVEPDWCTKGHIGYLLEGELDLHYEDQVVHFRAGDGAFIPAGDDHKHKASVVSDIVRLVLVEDA
jgi:quercetin dioxygenase-like cupin family protein